MVHRAHQGVAAIGVEGQPLQGLVQALGEQGGAQRVVVLARAGRAAQRGEKIAQLVQFGPAVIIDHLDQMGDGDVLQGLLLVDQAERIEVSRGAALQRVLAARGGFQHRRQGFLEAFGKAQALARPGFLQQMVLGAGGQLALGGILQLPRQHGQVCQGVLNKRGERRWAGHGGAGPFNARNYGPGRPGEAP